MARHLALQEGRASVFGESFDMETYNELVQHANGAFAKLF